MTNKNIKLKRYAELFFLSCGYHKRLMLGQRGSKVSPLGSVRFKKTLKVHEFLEIIFFFGAAFCTGDEQQSRIGVASIRAP
jgi:hypothetical protein